MRLKFKCQNVVNVNNLKGHKIVELNIVEGDSEENKHFKEICPEATLKLLIPKIGATHYFTSGNEYYLDFTEVNKKTDDK